MTNLKEGQPRRQVTDGSSQEGGRTPTTRRGHVFTFWSKYTAGGTKKPSDPVGRGGLAHPSSRMSQPRCSRHLDAARVAFSFRLLMIDLLMSRAGPLVLPRDPCAARDSRGCAREESETRRASSFREILGGGRIRLKSFRGPCARVGAVRACGLKATGGRGCRQEV